MKKMMFIPLSILMLMGCEAMELNEEEEELYRREVMDREEIMLEEERQLEMKEDEALGYPDEN